MKVYPFKIAKPLHGQLIVQTDQEPIFYNRLHQHEEIQISLIVNGNGKLVVGDSVQQFSTGEIFVIGSNLPHLFQSTRQETDAKMISLFFTESSFGQGFFNIKDLETIVPFFDHAIHGFKLLSKGKKVSKLIQEMPRKDRLDRFTSFLKLLDWLTKAKKHTLTRFLYNKVLTNDDGERLQIIYKYTIQNFTKHILLKDVSSMAFLTPNAFCKFFKQRTNKTYFEFLIELRVEHAAQLLQSNNGQSVSEIAQLSGFNSVSNFNRKFKKIKGTTPRLYQKLV